MEAIATDPLEIELKLEFDPADREALEAARPKGAEGKADRLVSTYFDTPGRDVLRAGYVLRVRRCGRRRVQTVKRVDHASAGLFVRAEWEHPIRGNAPLLDQRSGPLAVILGDAAQRLEPIFVTDVRRTVFELDREGATVTLAIDEGEVRAGARAETIREIELELGAGPPQQLFDLARELNACAPLRLGVRSKSERGYALLGGESPAAMKAEPVTLDAHGDAGDALGVIARACLRQFRLNEALLPSGGPEPVHQARVALRRLRSAFSLYGHLLAGDRKAQLLRAELRWLAAALGEVRNLDVLIPRCGGDARDRLVAAREKAFADARAELAGPRTRLLMIDLAEWIAAGAWRTAVMPQGARPFASDLLSKRRARLKRRGAGLAELDNPHRHRARIEAKKLRYASEFFASLNTGDKAQRRYAAFLDALEALQDLLGELNDLAVGPELLAALGIDARVPKSGKRRRARLLGKAEAACARLMKAKRFW